MDPVIWQEDVTFAVDNVGVRGKGFEVPAGAQVLVRSKVTNVNNANIAADQDSASSALGLSLSPNTVTPFPVRNTREVWAAGKAGESVHIIVMRG